MKRVLVNKILIVCDVNHTDLMKIGEVISLSKIEEEIKFTYKNYIYIFYYQYFI